MTRKTMKTAAVMLITILAIALVLLGVAPLMK